MFHHPPMESKSPQLHRTATMEAFQQLSIESFSYRWLINMSKSSFDAVDTPDGASFIEMDPKMASLNRAAGESEEFDFGLSGSHSPVLVSADQIFSNGLLLPLHVIATPGLDSSCSSDSLLSRSFSVDSSRVLLSLSKRYLSPELSKPVSVNSSPLFGSVQGRALSLDSSKRGFSRKTGPKLPLTGSCGRSSKKMLQKYLRFLMPLCKKVRSLGMIMALGSNTRVPASRRRSTSLEVSAGGSDAFLRTDWGRGKGSDLGIEKSIDEAVLHCKKSSGQNR